VDAEIVELADRRAWRRWLTKHHTRQTGIWLTVHKQGSTSGSLGYDDAVREALCFGWIDATAKKLDEDRYLQWMAPRRPRSGWSASNKQRVEELAAQGAMTAAGLAAIEAAKADGSWSKLDLLQTLEVPDDLAAAFRKHRGARANWDAFPKSVRGQILLWIDDAKRPETRARRVERTASDAAENVRANQ
jgi:uncharacterized protein YdeI (YjbR/CyaY-like superfamily)